MAVPRLPNTLTWTDIQEAREQVCEALLETADADFAGFFNLARRDGQYVHTDWAMTGDSFCREHCSRTEGRPFDAHPSWDPEEPPGREVNRFATLRRSRTVEQMEEVPSWRRHSPVMGVQDMARMLVYDGPRFVGWVGTIRLADRPEFTRAEARALSATERAVAKALVTCDAAFRLGESDTPASVLLRPDGTVEFATSEAGLWLARYGPAALGTLVRRFDHGVGPHVALIGTCRVRVSRMVDRTGHGTRYLAVLDPPEVPHMSPLARLSPRRREVAEYAAAGATTAEIAETLGVSTETVRSQLKGIYRALGVSNRVELLNALERREPPPA